MAHHYDGYDINAQWSTDSVRQIAAICRAIEIIENLEDTISISNQEVLFGLRAALKTIRKNNKFTGEF
jgi:hypothetical protein|tara:strand:- start:282 stop:485 length:204 start_codon:yes stop_codon:yes gene_type:complete